MTSDVGGLMCGGGAGNSAAGNQLAAQYQKSSEQIMVDMIREDLGVSIEPQAWRMFLRHRWERIHVMAHRIHEGKR